jgi:putative tryptophan/tyrosine transport system substrate-binding protein
MNLLRSFAVALVAALCGVLIPASETAAQATARVPVIGYLAQRAGPWHLDKAFVDGLRELGYVEGRNIVVEYRWGANAADLPALAADLARLKVDVIVSSGYPANKAAKDATSTIPIVMATSGDAVQEGLVASLSRPGGNVTGLSVLNRELTGKRLEVMKEAVPMLKKIGALYNGANPAMPPQFREVQVAAQRFGLEPVPLDVSFPAGIDAAFVAASQAGVGAIMVLSDSSTIAHRSQLSTAAMKYRMPTMFSNRDYIRAGGLMSYGPNLADNFRRAASIVDAILKGANPALLPVEQPTKFELVINRTTARALRLDLPQALLVRVDEIFD